MKRHSGSENAVAEELTEEERKLYDRQIRLWGLDAQKRLNKFRVCIAGKEQHNWRGHNTFYRARVAKRQLNRM